MSPEQVQSKLVQLADAIAKLRTMPQGTLEEFRSDDRNVDAALRRLQVAIQILIDVGSHIVSRLGLGAPETSQDLLDRVGWAVSELFEAAWIASGRDPNELVSPRLRAKREAAHVGGQ